MQSNIIKASFFTPISGGRWGLPLLLWAGPGVAKTSVIEEICFRYGLPCETLSPSERGEGAFGVVPVPQVAVDDYTYMMSLSERVTTLMKGNKVSHEEAMATAFRETPKGECLLTYPAPEWTKRFAQLGRGVVFVDEITSTPPALMAPLMGMFLARRIGGHTFAKGVRCIAAANPPEKAASGYDLPMPLANRMGHIDWEGPGVEEHTQFMLRGDSGHNGMAKHLAEVAADEGKGDEPEAELSYDAEGEEKRVLKAWPNAWARAVGLETSFLMARSGAKNMEPKVGDPKGSRAWPSDRTWEFATRALASSIVHGLSDAETEQFVEAFIGTGIAGEWFTFMTAQDLPDPSQLLDGKVSFTHDSKRVDRTAAVLQSCVALVAPKVAIKRADRSDALWAIIDKMTSEKADLDIVVPTVQALIELDLHSMKTCAKTLAKINPILRAAGIQSSGRR